MAEELRSLAVVLEKIESGEFDRLYTLYLRDFGKMRVKATGVRRPHARLAPHLETLMLSEVVVMRSRGRGVIKSALSVEDFSLLRENENALGYALEGTTFLKQFLQEGAPDPELFVKLRAFLSLLEEAVREGRPAPRMGLLKEAFFFFLARHLGFAPVFVQCAICKKSLRSEQDRFFSYQAGGVLCRSHTSRDALALDPLVYKALLLLQQQSWRGILRLDVSSSLEKRVTLFRQRYFQHWLS